MGTFRSAARGNKELSYSDDKDGIGVFLFFTGRSFFIQTDRELQDFLPDSFRSVYSVFYLQNSATTWLMSLPSALPLRSPMTAFMIWPLFLVRELLRISLPDKS